MPKVFTKGSLPEAVMTATRGPDVLDQLGVPDERLKAYTASVIRFWIEGWSYGTTTGLPFVVLPIIEGKTFHRVKTKALEEKIFRHYEDHIVNAAAYLRLPVLLVSKEVWETLPLPPPEVQVLSLGDRPISKWHRWARGWISAFTKTGAFDEQGE